MRLTFWKPKPSGLPAYRLILLDQAGTAELNRLASARQGNELPGERSPKAQRAQGPSLATKAKRVLLPLLITAFGGLATAAMVFSIFRSVTNNEGLGLADVIRVVIVIILTLLFLAQALAAMRLLPGVSWLFARVRVSRLSTPTLPLHLLDQVPSGALARQARSDIGLPSRASRLRSKGRGLADLGSWLLLVLLAVAVALFLFAGKALGAWSLLLQGSLGIEAVFRIAFLLFGVFALVTLAKVGLRGLARKRDRRRKRLVRRLLNFFLRTFHSGRQWMADAAGISRSGSGLAYARDPGSPLGRLSRLSASQAGRTLLVATAAIGLAMYPALTGGLASTGASANNTALGGLNVSDSESSNGGGRSSSGIASGNTNLTPTATASTDATVLASRPDTSEDPGQSPDPQSPVIPGSETLESTTDSPADTGIPTVLPDLEIDQTPTAALPSTTTASATSTSIATQTPTSTFTATWTPTLSPTSTFTPVPTATNTPTPTNTPSPADLCFTCSPGSSRPTATPPASCIVCGGTISS